MMIDSDLERAADSIMRAVDFVEERMSDDIGAQDMAEAACYSAFYFSRLFVRATGHAPYDYLMRRRVASAAERVAGGDRSITDIALGFGFDVPDTFARAFRRCFGRLPSEARREGGFPRQIARARISRSYVEYMLAEGPPAAQAEEADDMAVVGERHRCGGSEPPGYPEEGKVMVVERDESLRPKSIFEAARAACAASAGQAPPALPAPSFPQFASSIPGGPRARFRASPSTLPFVIEFAYRAWLPQAGRSAAPAFDLVEAGPGGVLSLVLPLPPGP